MRHMTGTRGEIESAIAIEDAHQGYPRPGTDSAGTAASPGWDGRGNPPAGWTTTCAMPRRHPNRTREFSLAIENAEQEGRLIGRRVGARTVSSADIRERPAEWETDADTPVRGR